MRLIQGGLLLGLLLVALDLWGAVRRPRRHRVFQDLAKYGDVDDIVEQVEADIEESGRTLGRWIVGREWLIRESLTIQQLKELAWVNQGEAVTDDGHTTCKVTLGWRNGQESSATFQPADASALMALLAERAPWLPRGLSPAARQEWNESRAAFLARLDGDYRAHQRPALVDEGDEAPFRLSE